MGGQQPEHCIYGQLTAIMGVDNWNVAPIANQQLECCINGQPMVRMMSLCNQWHNGVSMARTAHQWQLMVEMVSCGNSVLIITQSDNFCKIIIINYKSLQNLSIQLTCDHGKLVIPMGPGFPDVYTDFVLARLNCLTMVSMYEAWLRDMVCAVQSHLTLKPSR